jgi:ketosteroid isomerase-like protein
MPSHKELALAYLDAVGRKDFNKVEALLDPNVRAQGPVAKWSTAAELIASLKRVGAIHVRNEPERVFEEGDEVLVIYRFVTDSPLGAFPTIEWLRFKEGRICQINLYYDRLPWQTFMEDFCNRPKGPSVMS